MGTIEFLGITFRSAQHLEWFILTLVTLGANIYFIAVCWVSGKRYTMPLAFCAISGGFSLFYSILAAIITDFGAVSGPIWSGDCIWYNALLSVIYILGAALCGCLEKRRLRGLKINKS